MKKRELMMSVIGIGERTSLALLLLLPELGTTNRRKICSLAGVAPMHKFSGLMDAPRPVKGGGRKKVRTGALHGIDQRGTSQPTQPGILSRSEKGGKKGRAIFIAVARKLLIHLNGLLERETLGEQGV
jgi:transposase